MTAPIRALTEQDLASLAAALRSGRVPVPVSDLSLRWLVPPGAAAGLATSLEALRSGGSPGQLAAILELLREDRATRPGGPGRCDLVTTGPDALGVTHRGTAAVVRELFAGAERSVLVAGYAVYGGARIFEALGQRMAERPGLRVRLYLDVQRKAQDSSTDAAIRRRFVERFRQREWPTGVPLPEIYYDPRSLAVDDHKAVLHTKCIVADGERVFVSSANLTEAAQQRNIELGLLVTSRGVAGQVEAFFEALTAAGSLVPLNDA